MSTNNFYQQDILSVDQFSSGDLKMILDLARHMQQMVEKKGSTDILKGKMMTALFYEPSSRTFGSFVAAIQRLGGGFIPLQGVSYSSVQKGETLVDTVRTFASYSDVVVLRHPEVGSAKLAAEFCDKPLINAGDGVGEHPTQALLDLFTINNHFKGLKGLTLTLVGDLLNGRTVHSLTKLVSLYAPLTINLVSPTILALPQVIIRKLKDAGVTLSEHEEIDEVLPNTDVLYITRVQKERFTDLDLYESIKHRYVITPTVIKPMKKNAIIMHPFPRVGEIDLAVDSDPRALYIGEQMRNGMYMRMALLAATLLKKVKV